MAFLADIGTIVLSVFYMKLNRRLFKWRLEVQEKYPPRARYNGGSVLTHLKNISKAMLEFVISVSLICGLLVSLMFALYRLFRISHQIFQIAFIPCLIYWMYTFIYISWYPDSKNILAWINGKLFKTAK